MNQCQAIAPLVDKTQTLENGSQNLVAHIRLPAQHIVIINGGRQQSRTGDFNHIIINRNLNILARQSIVTMHDGVPYHLSNGIHGIFPARIRIDTFNPCFLVDVPENERISFVCLSKHWACDGFPVDELVG